MISIIKICLYVLNNIHISPFDIQLISMIAIITWTRLPSILSRFAILSVVISLQATQDTR